MSDDNDKVRRNLVMASAVIVFSYWLDISLAKIIERLSGVSHVEATEWRLWVIGFSLMIYLMLRYNFSKEGHAYRSAIATEVKNQRFSKTLWLVEKEANRFTKTGYESPIFKESLNEAIANQTLQRNRRDLLKKGIRPYVRPQIYEQGQTAWEHKFTLTTVYPDGMGATSGGRAIDVMIDKTRHRFLINAWAYLHAHLYTEASITNAVPVYMGTLAIGVLWMKVIAGYA